jgi:ribosomal protein S24E
VEQGKNKWRKNPKKKPLKRREIQLKVPMEIRTPTKRKDINNKPLAETDDRSNSGVSISDVWTRWKGGKKIGKKGFLKKKIRRNFPMVFFDPNA